MEHTHTFNPSSLALVKGKYYVVCTVPIELRDLFGKQKRLSTGTSDKNLASLCQHELTEEIYREFRRELKMSRFKWAQQFMIEEGIKGSLSDDDPEAIEHILNIAKFKSEMNESVGFDTDTKAIRELEAFLAPSEDRDHGILKLRDVAEQYFDQVNFERVKTKKANQGQVNEFIGFVGNLPIGKLQKQHAYSFAKHLDGKGRANQTISAKISSMSSMLTWAEQQGLIDASPFVNLKLSSYGKKSTSYRPLPHDVLRSILIETPKSSQERLLFTCLLLTGARLDEWATATYENIKTSPEGILYLDLSDAVVKNSGSQRFIPLHPVLVALLQNHNRQSGRIFSYPVDSDGKAQNAASKKLMRLIRKYTQDKLHAAHSLRGNLKDMLRDLGVPKEVNDQITGHSSGDVAGKYGHGASLKVRYDAICRIDASELGL